MTFKANPFFWQRNALKKSINTKTCEHNECDGSGVYRAPRRDKPQDIKRDANWHWFCLDHVREYNAAWDFYKDMSEEEIIEHWKRDITWDRPSWPLGSWQVKAATKPFLRSDPSMKKRNDPFGLFEDETSNTSEQIFLQTFNNDEIKAIKLFGLSIQYTKNELQKTYRELVKKHHPDVNGGCSKAENHIKEINIAYKILQKRQEIRK